MTTGWIENGQAFVNLVLIGAQGDIFEVRASIDTGFSGWLTLPQRIIDKIGFPWIDSGHGQLADGTDCFFDIYDAHLIWNNLPRRCNVSSLNSSLIGMAFLKGYEVNLQIIDGGTITIKSIASNLKPET